MYTLGDIGKHRVVSTKLPMAGGQSRDALIATGGTTTRLLGTFQVKKKQLFKKVLILQNILFHPK